MICDFFKFVGQVAEGVAGKHGMGGEHGGGKDGAFHAHGGNQRLGDGDGAFSHARNVLNGDDAFHEVAFLDRKFAFFFAVTV